MALTLLPGAAVAAKPSEPWPPAKGPGLLFVHYGEEHWNDEDGLTLLPKVVADSALYRPALVTMSGDKGNDGEVEQLERWEQIMSVYDKAGVPYLAGVGNHDRKSPIDSQPGVSPVADITNYKNVFADRPYPMGDAAAYAGIGPARPADDPAGASSHYYADIGNVRWIFIDNSCFSIINCDPLQSPPNGEGLTQYEFLAKWGKEATAQGKKLFVVMHMPTRDPRDQDHADLTSRNHVMGKGATTDNTNFEIAAAEAGADGVFVGHIKGQWLYKGRGDVPYYIDGGAGGELYTEGPVGTDHGYWHGYRLLRVDGDRIVTDTVPIFVENGITIESPPARLARGERHTFQAFGKQPVFKDPAKVERLALRDPNPKPKSGGASAGIASALPSWLLFAGPPLLLLVVTAGGIRLAAATRGRWAPLAFASLLMGVMSAGAIAVAQDQDVPTSTPKESLPIPARIWTSSNGAVVGPVAADPDDPRRDPKTQTDRGMFEGRCPGRAQISITSGWESASTSVTVPSQAGPIFRGLNRRARSVRPGKQTTLATVRLAQPARIAARVLRGKRVVANIEETCRPAGRAGVRWDGLRVGGRKARRGRYLLEIRVRSDRRVVVRRLAIRVR